MLRLVNRNLENFKIRTRWNIVATPTHCVGLLYHYIFTYRYSRTSVERYSMSDDSAPFLSLYLIMFTKTLPNKQQTLRTVVVFVMTLTGISDIRFYIARHVSFASTNP